MNIDKEMREEIISKCVKELTETYKARDVKTMISSNIAEKIADDYYKSNEVELLKNVDIETVTRIATLQLVSKLARDLS